MKNTSLKAGRPSRNIPSRTLASLRDEDKSRINGDIPTSLFKQVKHRATDENTTVVAIMIKALTEYLGKGVKE